MRTYDIIDTATAAVVGQQTCEDILAPVLLAGHEAQLTHIDGEPAAATPQPTVEPAAAPQPATPAPASAAPAEQPAPSAA